MLEMKVDVFITDALKKLDEFDQGKWARDVGEAIAEEQVLPFFRQYPEQTHNPFPFVSDKQRRYVSLEVGRIGHGGRLAQRGQTQPYRRKAE